MKIDLNTLFSVVELNQVIETGQLGDMEEGYFYKGTQSGADACAQIRGAFTTEEEAFQCHSLCGEDFEELSPCDPRDPKSPIRLERRRRYRVQRGVHLPNPDYWDEEWRPIWEADRTRVYGAG